MRTHLETYEALAPLSLTSLQDRDAVSGTLGLSVEAYSQKKKDILL